MVEWLCCGFGAAINTRTGLRIVLGRVSMVRFVDVAIWMKNSIERRDEKMLVRGERCLVYPCYLPCYSQINVRCASVKSSRLLTKLEL